MAILIGTIYIGICILAIDFGGLLVGIVAKSFSAHVPSGSPSGVRKLAPVNWPPDGPDPCKGPIFISSNELRD